MPWELSPFDLAGLLTHLAVLGLGVAGVAGVVALPRRRRSGLGLILMALAMAAIVIEPRSATGEFVQAVVHVVLFAIALWLLIGPVRQPAAPEHSE